MTKESGVIIPKIFNSILKRGWAKYHFRSILSLHNRSTGFLQQEVILSYKNIYLINKAINFTSDSKIEGKSYSGLKVRPIFILKRNQVKNKTLIRFKFYGNDK